MRLIDADALEAKLEEQRKWYIKVDMLGAEHLLVHGVLHHVWEAPTIDAVPVVRCKDCKYMTEHYDTDGNVPYWTCSEWDFGTDYDGFCHYAERKDNEID